MYQANSNELVKRKKNTKQCGFSTISTGRKHDFHIKMKKINKNREYCVRERNKHHQNQRKRNSRKTKKIIKVNRNDMNDFI